MVRNFRTLFVFPFLLLANRRAYLTSISRQTEFRRTSHHDSLLDQFWQCARGIDSNADRHAHQSRQRHGPDHAGNFVGTKFHSQRPESSRHPDQRAEHNLQPGLHPASFRLTQWQGGACVHCGVPRARWHRQLRLLSRPRVSVGNSRRRRRRPTHAQRSQPLLWQHDRRQLSDSCGDAHQLGQSQRYDLGPRRDFRLQY